MLLQHMVREGVGVCPLSIESLAGQFDFPAALVFGSRLRLRSVVIALLALVRGS